MKKRLLQVGPQSYIDPSAITVYFRGDAETYARVWLDVRDNRADSSNPETVSISAEHLSKLEAWLETKIARHEAVQVTQVAFVVVGKVVLVRRRGDADRFSLTFAGGGVLDIDPSVSRRGQLAASADSILEAIGATDQ